MLRPLRVWALPSKGFKVLFTPCRPQRRWQLSNPDLKPHTPQAPEPLWLAQQLVGAHIREGARPLYSYGSAAAAASSFRSASSPHSSASGATTAAPTMYAQHLEAVKRRSAEYTRCLPYTHARATEDVVVCSERWVCVTLHRALLALVPWHLWVSAINGSAVPGV